ncbi:hypothetical protein CLHUN_22830 [Ruminiclostridium hungatei]|uniref:Phosphodiester glycosidase domain-containing protein n=1 Tax=Ruminiclostridium hungatei TaxID=48256 RepID=A0A1V4SJ66_RUMHU|nr:phosphodiester glycosidase family protein [Ruminiclostridium hungatei]OPX43803.1 hypothetical protein CLHUN_22830 [Ruminiclostridium hungatei]
MKKSNHKLIIIIVLIGLLTLSFIFFHAGQFLFFRENLQPAGADTTAGDTESGDLPSGRTDPLPLEYKHISTVISGYRQEIFTLEFDPSDHRIEFKPVLSYDNVFGFEKLSEISARTGAYAAINGGFSYEYGDPVGMAAVDGKLLMAATGYDPVFIMDKSGARFEKITSVMSFLFKNESISINKLNRSGKDGNIILYTSDYGSTNRAEVKNTSVRVRNGIVTDVYYDAVQVGLTKDTQLVSFFGKKATLPGELGIKAGDPLSIKILPDLGTAYQAFSFGSMLVKGGKAVVPENDRWAGTLLNRDPRTAVGIMADGRLLLIVADGRQPGYSTGLTGKELAEYMIKLGVEEAAMLDGGASSQMLVEGTLKNRPSDRGMERPVASAFIIRIKDGP